MVKIVTGAEAELRINLSYNIRYAIMDDGTSAAAVARKAGIKPHVIHTYIRGTAIPDLSIVKRIADALGRDVSDLTKTYDPSMPGSKEEE